jgi:uncharacterized Rmd1/YagE family protein
VFRARFLEYAPGAMPVVEVHAYAIASTLPIKGLLPVLTESTPESKRVAKTQLTVHLGERRWVVAYDFGAVVFLDATEEERKATLERIRAWSRSDETRAKVGPELHPPMREEIVIEIDEQKPSEALFDRVVLPRLDAESVELVALVVAQSAAMECYEDDVDTLLAKVQIVARELQEHGKTRGSVRDLVRFVGSGMTTRNQVVYALSLLDAPDLVWNDERLDRVYRGLRQTFEIEARYRALREKLMMTQDNLEILVDLGQHRRSLWLESAVAIMIALEVVLFVYQIWKM